MSKKMEKIAESIAMGMVVFIIGVAIAFVVYLVFTWIYYHATALSMLIGISVLAIALLSKIYYDWDKKENKCLNKHQEK